VQQALHSGKPLDAGLDVFFAWLGTLGVVAGAFTFVLTVR
jgi:hypothetical protein